MRELESERIRIFHNGMPLLRQVLRVRGSILSLRSCLGFLQSCMQDRQRYMRAYRGRVRKCCA